MFLLAMDGGDLENDRSNKINYCCFQTRKQQHHSYRDSRRSVFRCSSNSGSACCAKTSFLFILVLINILIVINLSVLSRAEYVYGEPKYKCPKSHNLIYPCRCLNGSDVGVYVTCDKTNLATLSLGLQNLGALRLPIEHLTIYKGQFYQLYGPLFSKTQARILTIEDSPLETLEDYIFFGLNNTLEQLYLKNTNLSQVTPLSFGILSKVTKLVIDGHNFTTLNKDLFVKQEIANRLDTFRLINGPLNDLPIEVFQPLRKLKTLDLHGNNLATLKRNQFKNLRELEVLDISHNHLKKLESQHIADLTKLGWFNASHNELTELTRGTFARNAVLKVLNLSFNNIQRLDGNSFRGMRFLRRLYLSDNRISDVGRGTFGSINRIGTIDLARNLLKKVDFQMFWQLNYIEIIDVAENNITIIEKNSFKDIYQASINISHNHLGEIQSKAFQNCVNITILDLSFNNLHNFSKGCFDETTFPSNLQISYNHLTNLAQVPMHNMTGLRVLNASHNQITQVPKNCFPKLYELHTIDLSWNNVTIVFNGVFQTLFSLRSLDLSHNQLSEIKSSMLGTLPTLLELNLSHNQLTNIVRSALVKLNSVRWLDLSHNQLEVMQFQIPISLNELYLNNNALKKIPENTWPVMNSLIYLNMNWNQLQDSLNADSFRGLLVLQKLHLQGNGITRPPSDALLPLNTLQYLYLQDNNITDLEKSAFGSLPVLFELNLSQNGLNDISKRAFEGLLQLLHLNLSRNSLKIIPNEAFIGLPSLRKLDLSFNRISKLDNKTNGIFDDLLSLSELHLQHNRISFVTRKSFPEHQYIPYNLLYLDLSHNLMPVLTYDLTFGTKRLKTLNVSNNQINDLRRGVIGNFTRLEFLDLSNNNLEDLMLQPHIFDLPINLTTISLENNQIRRLNFTEFTQKTPAFELIDLRGNKLEEFPINLVKLVRNGTQILFAGNPLHCDCYVRPLQHLLWELNHLNQDQEGIYCHTPIFNENQTLISIADESLECIGKKIDNELEESWKYEKLPDVRFRDVVLKHDSTIVVRWLVVSSRDVADFTLYIRDNQNTILYQKDYSYNVRKAEIPINKLQMTSNQSHGGHHHHGGFSNREICIIGRQSNGEIGQWYQTQCQQLPLLKMKKFSFLATLFSTSNSNAVSPNSSADNNISGASSLFSGDSKETYYGSSLLFLGLCHCLRQLSNWSL